MKNKSIGRWRNQKFNNKKLVWKTKIKEEMRQNFCDLIVKKKNFEILWSQYLFKKILNWNSKKCKRKILNQLIKKL